MTAEPASQPSPWHPSATAGCKRQDRDLPGPHWAEVWDNWPDAPQQVPPPSSDPAAWSWAIRKLRGGPAASIATGTAPDAAAAKQAVDDWLAGHGPLQQTLWNVVVPVIALLRGDDGEEANDRLTRALKAAGFDVYDPYAEFAGVVPVECDDQSLDESDPPPAGWPC